MNTQKVTVKSNLSIIIVANMYVTEECEITYMNPWA